MTPDEQRNAQEAFEISDKAFLDALELLQLIAVMQGQNKDPINAKLSDAGAARAAMVVRNGVCGAEAGRLASSSRLRPFKATERSQRTRVERLADYLGRCRKTMGTMQV